MNFVVFVRAIVSDWATNSKQVIQTFSSLLFDIGYYFDTFSTMPELVTGCDANTFQYIHQTGVYLLLLKADQEGLPIEIQWTRLAEFIH